MLFVSFISHMLITISALLGPDNVQTEACESLFRFTLIDRYIFVTPFQMTTTFPRVRMCDGEIILAPSDEARRLAATRTSVPAKAHEVVHAGALQVLGERQVPDATILTIRGQYEVQFGKYQGQSFHWVAENDLGYAGYIIASMKREGGSMPDTPLGQNKREFKVSEYYSRVVTKFIHQMWDILTVKHLTWKHFARILG